MSKDLSNILGDWEFDPIDETRNIRRIKGDDGRDKIQIRVKNGLIQWEAAGRPDGKQPYGRTSLLDFYRELIRTQEKRGKTFNLNKKQHAEIAEEIMDYYQRRVIFFQLGDYQGAGDDARHNLALMDIVQQYMDDPKAVMSHEKYRPFVIMDRTRAEALLAVEEGKHLEAVSLLEEGSQQIKQFYHQHDRTDLISVSQELGVLRELKQELRRRFSIPLSNRELLENLKRAKQRAIEEENYKEAARLRDQIDRLEESQQSSHP